MKLITPSITAMSLAAMLAPAPVLAQQSSSLFDLQSGLTKAEFKARTAELGSILRFRQLGDPETLGKGTVVLSVEFANTSIDDRYDGRSMPYPRVAARIGVGDRVDLGAWGGVDTEADFGLAGIEATIALLRQGPSMPVSLSIRPSITSIIGPSELWVGNASIDVAMSRAIGSFTPYVGVATSGSLGIERSSDVKLDPVVADQSISYAGVAYGWRKFAAAAEVEKGAIVSYGVRIGTRW